MGFAEILLSLVTLASIDSVNICAISTTALLALYSSSINPIGVRKLIPPFLFIIGVYIGYVLVGVAISSILAYYRVFLIIVIAIAIALLILDLREALRSEVAACKIGECLPSWLQRLTGPVIYWGSLAYGILVSWSFMLCSASPYFIFIGLISHSIESIVFRFTLILLYCFIIVTPLIIVALIPATLIEYVQLNLRTILVLRSLALIVVILLGLYYILL